MICEKCGKEFFEDWRKDKETRKKPCRFCSRACSASRDHSSIEYREKISAIIKNREKARTASQQQKEKNPEKHKKVCPICHLTFFVENSKKYKIYCSRKCYLIDTSHEYRKQTSGGYRERSGRSKSGYYKGIYCGSSWELAWMIYQIDHNIPFERFSKELKAPFTKRRYIPDFLQNGKIIEIKGRIVDQESLDEKNKIAEYNGYEVILKFKKDLTKEFSYVTSTYKVPEGRFYELYDTYKPQYPHICLYCKKEFSNNKENSLVCSRRCSALLNRQKVRKFI